MWSEDVVSLFLSVFADSLSVYSSYYSEAEMSLIWNNTIKLRQRAVIAAARPPMLKWNIWGSRCYFKQTH